MVKMVAEDELRMALAKRAYDRRPEYWQFRFFGDFYDAHFPLEGHLGTMDAVRIAREYLQKKGRL